MAAVVLVAAGCRSPQGLPVVAVDLASMPADVAVKEWQLLGPFVAPPGDDGGAPETRPSFSLDFLRWTGLSEDRLDLAQVLRIPDRLERGPFSDPRLAWRRWSSPRSIADFRSLFPDHDKVPRALYCFAVLESRSEGRLPLIVTHRDGLQLRLNDERLVADASSGDIDKYRHIVDGPIHRGQNLLMAKLDHSRFSSVRDYLWKLSVTATTPERAQARALECDLVDLLSRRLFPADGTLAVRTSLLGRSIEWLAVDDADGRPVLNAPAPHEANWTHPLRDWRPGLYHLRAGFAGKVVREAFFVGDERPELARLDKQYAAARLSEADRLSVQALLFRYEHLAKPENRTVDPRLVWEKKVVDLVETLQDGERAVRSGRRPFAHRPGLTLHAYRSRVDESVQDYLVYAPPACAGPRANCSAVVVFSHVNALKSRFRASITVAAHRRRKRDGALADRYGHVVIWVGSRGNVTAGALKNEEVLETLTDVRESYDLDPERIYAVGYCRGGLEALTMATRYPSLFAAVGLIEPITTRYEGASAQASRRWIQSANPLNSIENLSHVPLYVVHGKEDVHTPIVESERLVAACRQSGVPVVFDAVPDAEHLYWPDRDPLEMVFAFLQGKRRSQPDTIRLTSSQLHYARSGWIGVGGAAAPLARFSVEARRLGDGRFAIRTHNVTLLELAVQEPDRGVERVRVELNGRTEVWSRPPDGRLMIPVDGASHPGGEGKSADREGPIASAFAGPFVLVEGTAGLRDETLAIREVVDDFCEDWKMRFLAECPRLADTRVRESDLRSKHLVLFGSPGTNHVWSRLLSRLPMSWQATHITLGDRRFEGTRLSLRAVLPSPFDPRRYVALIGAQQVRDLSWGGDTLAVHGWYDYWIASMENGRPTPLDVGHFDVAWRHLVSARPGDEGVTTNPALDLAQSTRAIVEDDR